VKVSDGEWEDWLRGRTEWVMEWVKKVDEGSEVGRWKEWNGLMEREKGKELVRSGWPGGW
jgi:hypothetical protein